MRQEGSKLRIITDCKNPRNTFVFVDDKFLSGVQSFKYSVSGHLDTEDYAIGRMIIDWIPINMPVETVEEKIRNIDFNGCKLELTTDGLSTTTTITVNDKRLAFISYFNLNCNFETVTFTLECNDPFSNDDKKYFMINSVEQIEEFVEKSMAISKRVSDKMNLVEGSENDE